MGVIISLQIHVLATISIKLEMSKFNDIYSSNKFSDVMSFSDINLEQAFKLIDRILPIESCIHHQVLPVAIEGSSLIVGMLNPDHSSTLEEIRPLLSSLGLRCQVKTIDTKLFQMAIAEYVKYSCSPQQKSSININSYSGDRSNSVRESAPAKKKVNRLHDKPTLIVDPLEPEPEELDNDYFNSAEFLAKLPPQQLWQELFTRMLNGGIGRLHFQKASSQSRILLSQDGVPQLTLNNIEDSTYQKLIVEVKSLAKLPAQKLQAPKKVAIERHSGTERLLLRIKLTPGNYGDEATIQVLRGKALELYEQTHTDKLTEQALDLAQQLKKTLKHLRNSDRSDRIYLELLSTLKEVQIEISQQLQK